MVEMDGNVFVWHYFGITLQSTLRSLAIRITDEGLIPETRIWSIILSVFKDSFCILRKIETYIC